VSNLFGAVIAFILGAAIAAGNYALSRRVLKTAPNKFSLTAVARTLIQVIFIVLVYALSRYTPWDRLWLLAGGVLGMTLPMFWFTSRLIKLNDSNDSEERKEDPNG